MGQRHPHETVLLSCGLPSPVRRHTRPTTDLNRPLNGRVLRAHYHYHYLLNPPPLGRPEIPDPETPRGGVVMGSIKKNQGGDGFKGAEWVQASAPIMVITKERN